MLVKLLGQDKAFHLELPNYMAVASIRQTQAIASGIFDSISVVYFLIVESNTMLNT